MTRAEIVARIDAELAAWQTAPYPDEAVTGAQLDDLEMAIDDALETCTDAIAEEG